MRGSPPHPARATFSQGVLFLEAIIMRESRVHGRTKTANLARLLATQYVDCLPLPRFDALEHLLQVTCVED